MFDRKTVLIFFVGLCIGGCSDPGPPFSADTNLFYATASSVGDEAIIASIDSAIAPLGFRRPLRRQHLSR